MDGQPCPGAESARIRIQKVLNLQGAGSLASCRIPPVETEEPVPVRSMLNAPEHGRTMCDRAHLYAQYSDQKCKLSLLNIHQRLGSERMDPCCV